MGIMSAVATSVAATAERRLEQVVRRARETADRAKAAIEEAQELSVQVNDLLDRLDEQGMLIERPTS